MSDIPAARALCVAIDARLNAYRVGGISQYTSALIEALARIAPEDRLGLLEQRKGSTPLLVVPNVVRRRLWTPPHNRWEQWALPIELRRMKAHVLHCPDFIPPLRRRIPAVITVHDLAFLHFPEILDDDAKRYYGQIGAAVRSADAIIAVSEATRQDLQDRLSVPDERITVVPEAASELYRPLDLAAGTEAEINGVPLTAGSFGLFVGTIEPRKNLATLLHALASLRTLPDKQRPRLVLAGPRGWLDGP